MTGRSVPLLDALAGAPEFLAAGPTRGLAGHSLGDPAGDAPSIGGTKILVLDEFLARPELDALVGWVIAQEPQFGASQVIAPSSRNGLASREHRRSKVLHTSGPVREIFEQRLMSVLDHVRLGLGLAPFAVRKIETQITASNDGEYFRPHTDNSHSLLTGRHLTFVYFFHREPARFSGGRLRFYERGRNPADPAPGSMFAQVVPRQNQVVFFAPHYLHEIETINCPSHRFLDSRFTVNGWYWSS